MAINGKQDVLEAETVPPPLLQVPPADQLTIEDVQALMRSYQLQIMAKAGEVASLNMELARRDRIIAQMQKA